MNVVTVFVTVLIVAAVAVLVIGVLGGIFGFSFERAAAVMAAEETPTALPEQIQRLRIGHPEIIKVERLDRHHSYVWLVIGLWAYSWGSIVSEAPNSNLSSLSVGMQNALGVCLLAGSSMMLVGTLLGVKIGPLRVVRRVHDHLLSPLLGEDIRVPYALAWCGLLSTGAAMWLYVANTASSRLLGTLGGVLSIVIGATCVTLGPQFLRQAHRYSKVRDQLLDELAAQTWDQR